ncbi:uncharacterized protein K452DRAFT_241160 [Aplosporella prunicola CBS 121167]|uniref:MADS-box domain-containing protein n=1 Tax=Aplosporella prunicola CBS 121167 TaxID=1176127 RepID=A0A6A6BQR2_9PEZI|nr:uncharacterized protein K452DRAFT_241160 [Aplosporella prunicola CBS 121167]KAF2146426.1 hypothetical protein K452DRAFT_241160 [Aplosporella prunicola CBS 121167]
MGRRKIEIKAIKDDRNRSVTFLKRKGGLFKKAHELSVLCSVDVAVIIFGHNKKLYEFSSGDINETIGRYQYYGGAHEHKGPEDFMGKNEDDDEDEMGASPAPGSRSPPEHQMMMPHHLQNQQFQHIQRHATPSASPPINGMPFQHRHASPQPAHISRPSSAAHIRRTSSNLAPPQAYSQPQSNYAYRPNPPFYPGPHGMPQQAPPPHAHAHQHTYPPPAHSQVQQVYMQDQRRQSMPPVFSQPPQEPVQRQASVAVPSPPQPEHQFQSPPLPQPKPLPAAAKQSIFTPIDDSRSILAQHWGPSTTAAEQVKVEPQEPRAQSIDVAAIGKPQQTNGTSPQQPTPTSLPNLPQRTASTSSLPTIPPPTRTNSVQTDAKRPRLKVQIPDEHSEAENTSAASPKDGTTTGATTARGSTEASHSSGVVLPPPSPSASALLSAGATGPPNPFARPAPPVNNNNNYGNRDNMETPISALPSRFVADGLLPSPSSFYPEWGFGNSSNMLPSPLTFQTPVVQNGPSFRDEDREDRKRKASEGSQGGDSKKQKS